MAAGTDSSSTAMPSPSTLVVNSQGIVGDSHNPSCSTTASSKDSPAPPQSLPAGVISEKTISSTQVSDEALKADQLKLDQLREGLKALLSNLALLNLPKEACYERFKNVRDKLLLTCTENGQRVDVFSHPAFVGLQDQLRQIGIFEMLSQRMPKAPADESSSSQAGALKSLPVEEHPTLQATVSSSLSEYSRAITELDKDDDNKMLLLLRDMTKGTENTLEAPQWFLQLPLPRIDQLVCVFVTHQLSTGMSKSTIRARVGLLNKNLQRNGLRDTNGIIDFRTHRAFPLFQAKITEALNVPTPTVVVETRPRSARPIKHTEKVEEMLEHKASSGSEPSSDGFINMAYMRGVLGRMGRAGAVPTPPQVLALPSEVLQKWLMNYLDEMLHAKYLPHSIRKAFTSISSTLSRDGYLNGSPILDHPTFGLLQEKIQLICPAEANLPRNEVKPARPKRNRIPATRKSDGYISFDDSDYEFEAQEGSDAVEPSELEELTDSSSEAEFAPKRARKSTSHTRHAKQHSISAPPHPSSAVPQPPTPIQRPLLPRFDLLTLKEQTFLMSLVPDQAQVEGLFEATLSVVKSQTTTAPPNSHPSASLMAIVRARQLSQPLLIIATTTDNDRFGALTHHVFTGDNRFHQDRHCKLFQLFRNGVFAPRLFVAKDGVQAHVFDSREQGFGFGKNTAGQVEMLMFGPMLTLGKVSGGKMPAAYESFTISGLL